MLDHFGDESDMAGANFAEDTFKDPDETSDKPIPLFIVLIQEGGKQGKSERNLPKRHRSC